MRHPASSCQADKLAAGAVIICGFNGGRDPGIVESPDMISPPLHIPANRGMKAKYVYTHDEPR